MLNGVLFFFFCKRKWNDLYGAYPIKIVNLAKPLKHE